MIVGHILPNVASPIIVQTTITVAFAILAEAALSFVGLGIQPPAPSWGAMLNSGKIHLELEVSISDEDRARIDELTPPGRMVSLFFEANFGPHPYR